MKYSSTSFAPIHMKSWPKVKLGQVGVGSNIAQDHSSRKSDLTIIGPNSHESYYLLQFGFIYPYMAPKYHCCPYLVSLTYIYHYLLIVGLI